MSEGTNTPMIATVGVMPHIDGVVAACRRILDARGTLTDAIAERDRELVAMAVEDGIPKAQVAALVRARLLDEGFTEQQITERGLLGMSAGNVRLALDPRRQVDRPVN